MVPCWLLAIVAFGCSGDPLEPGQIGVLSLRDFEDPRLAHSGFGYAGSAQRAIPVPEGYAPPAGVVEPVFLELLLTFERKGFAALLGRSRPSLQRSDILWVDWDRDKKFGEGEKMAGVAGTRPGTSVFEPIEPIVVNGRTLRLAFTSHADQSISVAPSAYLGGRVELGGKTVSIGLVDADGNGTHGDTLGDNSGGDALLLDRNGNGKFDYAEIGSYAWLSRLETLPLAPWMDLDDGPLCRIVVSPDNSKVEVQRHSEPEGLVQLDGSSDGVMALSAKPPAGATISAKGKPMLGVFRQGRFRLPVGVYSVAFYEYLVADPSGREWCFRVRGKKVPDTVAAGAAKPVVVKCGFPLSLALERRWYRGRHDFSLTVRDRGGQEVVVVGDADRNRPLPPTLSISDQRGKVVKVLPFQYDGGEEGAPIIGSVVWTPASVAGKGAFTATASWKIGAFKTLVARVTFMNGK